MSYNRKEANPYTPTPDVPENRKYELGFEYEISRWENDLHSGEPWNPRRISMKAVLRGKQEKQRDSEWMSDEDTIKYLVESGELTVFGDAYIYKGKHLGLSGLHRLLFITNSKLENKRN